MKEKKINLYLINVLATMLILPLACIIAEAAVKSTPVNWPLIGKYFIFWAIGVRLLIAGLKQSLQPRFTAEQIFNIRNSEESLAVVRELGFANICLGLAGILSLFRIEWRPVAAITGGLYFGLAGLLHVFRAPASRNETIAKISDLFIFGVVLLYLFFTVIP
jgi:hypothetical protein